MTSLLILKRMQVQNANAIAGLTWGFPGISNFLGFTHALSRFVTQKQGVSLGGCAVICHHHQVQAYQPAGYGEYVFALTRNPLTKEGSTAPFNEEGRMHMEVSLVIECNFSLEDIDFDTGSDAEDKALLIQQITQKALTQRVAGGMIQHIEGVALVALPEVTEERDKAFRKAMLSLLPGFMLVDRSELLADHFAALKQQRPEVELIDAWLDFAAIKYRAHTAAEAKEGETPDEGTPADWSRVEKPAGGWLVPITTGYKAISPLYEPGEVANTRDASVPFRFVESVYSVGQWISPHRLRDINSIFWRYHQENDWYLCKNSYQPEPV
jgi:CRISPR-associated protein Csy2